MVVVVECPECETRYRIDVARLGSSGSLLKCTRCGHMFPPPSATATPAVAPPRRSKRVKPSSNDNLTLPFADGARKPLPPDDHEKTIEEPDESFTLGSDEPEPDEHVFEDPAPNLDAGPELDLDLPDEAVEEPDFEIPDEPEEDRLAPPPPPPPPPPAAPKPAPATAPRKRARPARRPIEEEPMVFGDDEEPAPTPVAGDRGKLRAIGVFLLIVVGFYALLWRTFVAEPALADRWLGDLPVIGPLATERLLAREISLVKVEGRYDRIRHGRGSEVFVITGDAMSMAPSALHSVRVRGRAFDAAGKLLDEKTIYCGNAVSAAILNDLSPREVSVLQQIQPPARFTIEPGAAKSFVIVFTSPPPGIASFTAEVVGARR